MGYEQMRVSVKLLTVLYLLGLVGTGLSRSLRETDEREGGDLVSDHERSKRGEDEDEYPEEEEHGDAVYDERKRGKRSEDEDEYPEEEEHGDAVYDHRKLRPHVLLLR